jgi:O-acetyl-ADP-ribose deacetylase (regulator of RNase III)
MITKHINDSILNTDLKYIAHGVNCQNAMGSGVAKVIYERHPLVKQQYHTFCKNKQPHELLGRYDWVSIYDDTTPVIGVFNCFTQLEYGTELEKRYVDYYATANIFRRLSFKAGIGQIAIPKIGCGLAGGNWQFMMQLLNDAIGDRLELWVYHGGI